MWNKKAKRSVDKGVKEQRSHSSMFGKVFAGFVGARVAESAGRSGLLGAATGLVAERVIKRSPMGAMLIGGLWVGKKLYNRNKQRQFDRAARNAKPVHAAKPDSPVPAPGSAQSTTATPPGEADV